MQQQSILDKYEIILKIGEGSSGIAYKARQIGSNRIVTLKKIKNSPQRIKKEIYQQNINEINILKDLKGCPHIVELIDIEEDETNKNLYIIYEYNEYSMDDLIYNNKPMTFQQVKTYFKQMLISINTLHSRSFIHRDIKPDNFLISSNNEIKLIDFSLSIKINEDLENSSYKVGTHGYMAPEVLLGSNKCGYEIDIWSLGCSFYEILTGEKLINNRKNESDIVCQMIQIFGFPTQQDFPDFFTLANRNLFIESKTSQKTTIEEILDNKLKPEFQIFKPLLIGMLQMNPKSRLKLPEILNFPVFQEIEAPENLPQIVISEPYSHKHKRNIMIQTKENRKRMNDIYDELRPLRIVPLLLV